MSVQIKPFYDKEKTCLYCKKTFSTKRLRTRFIRIEKIDSDFHTEYKDPKFNPVYYEVDVCPQCGFASSEMFSSHFPSGTTQVIAEQFKNWKVQDFGQERELEVAIRALKLGVLSGILKKEKEVVVGGLCLRLAWLYRSSEDEDQEIRFLKKALDHYKESYQKSDYLETQMSDIKLIYLIGELSRRLGRDADAINYFSKVIQHKNKAFETKIVDMAREQWYSIRHQSEQRATI
ncbi:DUF2225 domain-containing protein [Bacillus solitudinis]|uniref:DUF2225 domain-containing protein n=1 Tax=Bacillus solitudinis TaxID=2014074 RepID=UPI000C23F22B|nr:DUF2225 domain-containing protein [Bacillus solitudinis]